MENTKWITIRKCSDNFEAEMIKGILENEKIPVLLLNENSNALFPDTVLAQVEVKVPEEFESAAKKVVDEFDEEEA